MIKTSERSVKETYYHSVTCDKCHRELIDDDIERQEALFYANTGGFGCIWGDGTTLSFDLCQRCVFELVKPFARLDGVAVND